MNSLGDSRRLNDALEADKLVLGDVNNPPSVVPQRGGALAPFSTVQSDLVHPNNLARIKMCSDYETCDY